MEAGFNEKFCKYACVCKVWVGKRGSASSFLLKYISVSDRSGIVGQHIVGRSNNGTESDHCLNVVEYLLQSFDVLFLCRSRTSTSIVGQQNAFLIGGAMTSL